MRDSNWSNLRISRTAAAVLPLVVWALLTGQTARMTIAKVADLPPWSYSLNIPAEDVVTSAEAFGRFAGPVRADLLRLESGYDIQNDAIRRRVVELLSKLDMLTGDYNKGMDRAVRLRRLQTKVLSRLTTMLLEIASCMPGRFTSEQRRRF
jgi:hypothetical protein